MSAGVLGKHLNLTEFHSLYSELSSRRIDPVIQMMESRQEQGRILGFVRGLRVSARLIYALRNTFSPTDLEIDWGHLLDDNLDYCSPECDVIIHKKGHFARWNDHQSPVMDFKFILCQEALAVVSCKSFTQDVDAAYVREMKKYLKDIFLFAECCEERRLESLRKKAKQAGYRECGYLYTWNRKTQVCTKDEREWQRFLRSIERSVAHRYHVND